MLLYVLIVFIFSIVWRTALVVAASKLLSRLFLKDCSVRDKIDRSILLFAIIWLAIDSMKILRHFDLKPGFFFALAVNALGTLIPFFLAWLLLRATANDPSDN